jgi:glycosyltransferase involved in cell wall biosynthesis
MAAATVCTLPSYREGYPNVAVEAVSCGRPLVATNVGGIPEIINESCGVLVPPHDHPALAAGLACALQRQWDSNEVASKMQRGWEQVAAETLDACSAAIAEKQRRAARASVSSGAA